VTGADRADVDAEIARIEWHRDISSVDDHPRPCVSLRKPRRPMTYARLMEICGDTERTNAGGAS
jgi:hypothetical protein